MFNYIRLENLDIRWSGVNEVTPEGHVLVHGVDIMGFNWLCLYEGSEPDDNALRGSLFIPPSGHDQINIPTHAVAYGPTGAVIANAGNRADMLIQLANTEKLGV